MPHKKQATMAGIVAVLLWASLALFTVGAQPIPALQLNAVCFAIGSGLGLIWIFARGQVGVLFGVSWKIYAFGAAGLFGYHALYFLALRAAPPAQAGLIAYLWPLLIVLFSGFLPGESLRWGHWAGAMLGFIGAALLAAGGQTFSLSASTGYLFALAGAFTWAGYSVISRRFQDVPTESVVVYCAIAAVFSALLHPFFENAIWPPDSITWLSVGALGCGPVGIAFFLWDRGMKHGDIQLLGTISYAAPVLSTCALILAGFANFTWQLAISACLITGGAGLAALASTRPK